MAEFIRFEASEEEHYVSGESAVESEEEVQPKRKTASNPKKRSGKLLEKLEKTLQTEVSETDSNYESGGSEEGMIVKAR